MTALHATNSLLLPPQASAPLLDTFVELPPLLTGEDEGEAAEEEWALVGLGEGEGAAEEEAGRGLQRLPLLDRLRLAKASWRLWCRARGAWDSMESAVAGTACRKQQREAAREVMVIRREARAMAEESGLRECL